MFRSFIGSPTLKRIAYSSKQLCTRPKRGKKPPIETGTFQRSTVERKPKVIVGAFAIGLSLGMISMIYQFEATRTEGESDSIFEVIEPVSKSVFPLTLKSYAFRDSTHWLVSKSIRCMLNMCSIERARAYSYAIYLSTDGAIACQDCTTVNEICDKILPMRMCEIENQLGDESRKPDFISSGSFQGAKKGYVFKTDFQGLGYYLDETKKVYMTSEKEHSYPSMILRMVMLRSVGGDHIAHGFDKSVLKRIRVAQNNKQGTGKEALRKLNRFVKDYGEWEKGTILEFVRLHEGDVKVRVNGKEELVLRSESFSWALFDTFIGQNGHLNQEGKEELLSRTKEVASLVSDH